MIKNLIKAGLRFLLSLSLVFAPICSYSNGGSNNGSGSNGSNNPPGDPNIPPVNDNTIEMFIKRLEAVHRETQQAEIPAELQEAAQILREMGTALNENRLGEYIKSLPGLKRRFDILSLSNQQVKALDYDGKTTFVIDFDNENSRARYYERILANIDVGFNPEGKLVFEGVTVPKDKENKLKKKIGFIHTFQDMEKKDIVDWVYDKEVLAVLHKRRGLVLYHTLFADKLLGSAPIPSVEIPIRELSTFQDVKLEFVDRSVVPPKQGIQDRTVNVNLDGKPMFFAGDLLISNVNSEGKKNVVRVLSRSKDLMSAMFRMYVILESLIRLRDFVTSDVDQSHTMILERRSTDAVKTVLSVTLHGHAVSFFSKFTDLIHLMPYFLVYNYIDKNPDTFLHTEWLKDYQKIKKSSPNLFDQISKKKGKIISSEAIAEALKPIVAAKKEESENRFKQLVNDLEQQYPKAYERLKKYMVTIIAFLTFIGVAIWQSSTVPHVGGGHNYLSDTVYNIVFLGIGFLLITYLAGWMSVPFLKVVKKLPFLTGEMKLTLDQIINRWSGKDTPDRLVTFGFRVAAALLPFFYVIPRFLGQHHFHSALRKGVNPFRRIASDSHLGRAVGIDKPMLLGFSLPRWILGRKQYERRSQLHEKKSQLIDLIAERRERIEGLSRIMAYYALSGKPFDIRALLTGSLTIDDKFDYANKKLMLKAAWISEKLSQYILQSNIVDTTRPIFEWSSAINNEFYEKALSLFREVESVSLIRMQEGKLRKTMAKLLRLDWNTKQADILRHYYPDQIVSKNFWYGLIMDHLILVSAPLTVLTPRGDNYSGNLSKAAIESNIALRTSPPHMYEAGANVVVHDVAMARQQLQNQSGDEYEKLRQLLKKVENQYKPIKEYLDVTENNPAWWQYLLDGLKYPLRWGEKIYEGKEYEERIDPGYQLRKLFKIAFRFWAVTIPLLIVSREFFTPDYSLYYNITGSLYFAIAGMVIFGWPQIWAQYHSLFFTKKTEETKKIIDRIKQTNHKIENRLYTDSDFLDKDYEEAVRGFKTLYSYSRKYRKITSLDALDPGIREFVLAIDLAETEKEEQDRRLKEVIQSQTMEIKRKQLQTISLLLKTRHLPTKISEAGLQIALLATLGIFSNVVFVYVSEKSFQDVELSKPLLWLGGVALGTYILSFITARSISNHIKDARTVTRTTVRKAGEKIKGMGTSFKNKCSLSFMNKK